MAARQQLAVFGGKAGGGFPDEVGDLAVGGQALQGGVIHVGAEREPVVGAGQAGPGAGGLVGLAVFQDVGQVIGVSRSAAGRR